MKSTLEPQSPSGYGKVPFATSGPPDNHKNNYKNMILEITLSAYGSKKTLSTDISKVTINSLRPIPTLPSKDKPVIWVAFHVSIYIYFLLVDLFKQIRQKNLHIIFRNFSRNFCMWFEGPNSRALSGNKFMRSKKSNPGHEWLKKWKGGSNSHNFAQFSLAFLDCGKYCQKYHLHVSVLLKKIVLKLKKFHAIHFGFMNRHYIVWMTQWVYG